MSESVGRLILVRHGESEWNNLNVFCGWVDVSLTDKGRQQAGNAGKLMKESSYGLKPKMIFTSKLSRAIQTSNIIAAQIDRVWIDIVKSWKLNERHYGLLQGRKKSEVLQEVGKEKFMFWRRAYNGCPPSISNICANYIDERYFDVDPLELPEAESLHMVVNRVEPFFHECIKRRLLKGEDILVITHGSVVRLFIKFLSKVSDNDIQHVNIPNAIPLVYLFDKNLEVVDDYVYLDVLAAKLGAKEVENQGLSKI